MGQGLRRRQRGFASALLSILVVSLSVTCVASAEMTQADMACCVEMSGECGAAMAQDHDCCRTEAPSVSPQLAAGPRFLALAPVHADFVLLESAAPGVFVGVAAQFRRSSSSPPAARGIPAYLLLSTLRI